MNQVIRFFILFILLISLGFSQLGVTTTNDTLNYKNYHLKVLEAETLIANEKYQSALDIYHNLFATYSFVFLREYKVASQLAVLLNHQAVAFDILEKGILGGWSKKSINKNQFLSEFLKEEKSKDIMSSYEKLNLTFKSRLNDSLRNQVHDMFKRDQKLAIKALFKLSSTSQDKYAERKFAPNSENQMQKLDLMLRETGYPGQKIIGNDIWMSTILSHHNSISQAYAEKDSLYPNVRPRLLLAIDQGELSPFEFAMIDEWRLATLTNPTEVSYGFLKAPKKNQLRRSDSLRKAIGIRSVLLRNKLVDIEEKTGMDLYLFGSPWVKGKIELQ
ncbi:hypothetical protein [Lutimonas sp.]|uniref:hypothetical protein n=1 Tax=Lutimonas sp. TaxID=1872403 RepID=UPI003D9B69A9